MANVRFDHGAIRAYLVSRLDTMLHGLRACLQPAAVFAAVLAENRRTRCRVASSDHRRLTRLWAKWMPTREATPRAVAFADVPPGQRALLVLESVLQMLRGLPPTASPGHLAPVEVDVALAEFDAVSSGYHIHSSLGLASNRTTIGHVGQG